MNFKKFWLFSALIACTHATIMPFGTLYEETANGVECQGLTYNGIQKNLLKRRLEAVKHTVENDEEYENEDVLKKNLKDALKNTMEFFCEAEKYGDSVEWHREGVERKQLKPISDLETATAMIASITTEILPKYQLMAHKANLEKLQLFINERIKKTGSDDYWGTEEQKKGLANTQEAIDKLTLKIKACDEHKQDWCPIL